MNLSMIWSFQLDKTADILYKGSFPASDDAPKSKNAALGSSGASMRSWRKDVID